MTLTEQEKKQIEKEEYKEFLKKKREHEQVEAYKKNMQNPDVRAMIENERWRQIR